jgi:hypothetical protein
MLRLEALDPTLESLPLGSELRSQGTRRNMVDEGGRLPRKKIIRLATTSKQPTNEV